MIFEFLSLPLAFHPAINFIKRRITETRELACDELVIKRLLDASDYARSLLHLAASAIVPHRRAYTLGIFEADNLEERIMKLVERKPQLTGAGKTVMLAAVLSLLIASGTLAAILSLKIEQRAKEPNPIEGDWELFLSEDGGDPNDRKK
jgi:beta-lactamase regulating signal transducer with metallopeptidase domain